MVLPRRLLIMVSFMTKPLCSKVKSPR